MSELDILVVEDEPVVVQAARRVLQNEGLRIDAVADGEAARERLRQRRYRGILLDLMLPGVAGLELLETMIAEQPDAPVIVTTGYATAQKTVAVLKAGAFDFLPKPFDAEELLGIFRRCLRWRDRRHEVAGEGEPDSGAGALHRLGDHSWARLEEDGLATLGASEAFVASIEGALRFRLPAAGAETVQGAAFASVESSAAEVHRLWAPLSGQVVGSNESLDSDPARVRSDPLGEGWLTRVAPLNLQEELHELTAR